MDYMWPKGSTPIHDFSQLSSFAERLNTTIFRLVIEKNKPLHIFKTNVR